MTKVLAGFTTSVAAYVAGPDDRPRRWTYEAADHWDGENPCETARFV
jgi:hypothetical protein